MLCAVLLVQDAAEAQTTPQANATTLTVEEVRRLAEQAKQVSDLDESTCAQIEALYTQAIEQLELAAGWRAKARTSTVGRPAGQFWNLEGGTR